MPLTKPNTNTIRYTYDTLADLRADFAQLRGGMYVRTMEHTAGAGYEGGNVYLIRASTGAPADNGSIIGDLSNVFIEAVGTFPDGVNVKQFGAIGDGVTDDSTKFTSADAFGAFTVPAGTYKISNNITLTNDIDFLTGGTLSVDSGKTVTFSGSVQAGIYAIFSGSGSVSISQGEAWAAWFGAVYDDTTDGTAALDAAAVALGTDGGTVRHTSGAVRATSLTIYNRVVHEGVGNGTVIRCLSSGSDFIGLDTGPVQYAGFRKLRIAGSESASPFTAINAGQWAFSLTAVADASTTGGWWRQIMSDVHVAGFDNGINLIAGDNFSLPHQFAVWKDVEFIRNDAGGKCLRMENQVEQILGLRCRFDAIAGSATGINVECVAGTLTRPNADTFIKGTIQNTDQGIVSSGSHNVHFVDTWFENIKRCVTLSFDNRNFEFGGRFSNAANSSGNGYIVTATGSGSVMLRASLLAGTTDKIVDSLSNGVYFNNEILANAESATAATTGVSKQVSESAGVLTCGEGKTFLVNTSVTNITQINSDRLAGDSIFLKAFTGTIKLATGGNISVGSGASPLTILQNEVVQLVRYDIGGTWQVVGK
jgi:hypothetical protein